MPNLTSSQLADIILEALHAEAGLGTVTQYGGHIWTINASVDMERVAARALNRLTAVYGQS
jgi:hypothetical protein